MPKHLTTKDILNTVYGSLTIIEDLGTTGGIHFVVTRCVCGIEKKQRLGDLRKKTRRIKCVCLPREYSDERFKSVDFVPIGSRLTFITLTDKKRNGSTVAVYRCECGTKKELRTNQVKQGTIKTCGCSLSEKGKWERTIEQRANFGDKFKTHGLSKHPLYQIWGGIVKRCEDKNCKAYPYYGGNGVVMCKEWRDDFTLFYDWALLNGWKRGLHVDKDIIPKKLGIPALIYSPEMCSVVTMKENMNAISTNVNVEYLGKTQTLKQWAEEYGINYKAFWSRLKLGFEFGLALTRPNRTIQETSALNRKIILNTETGIFYFGFKEAAESIGIKENTLYGKIHCRRYCKNDTPFILA